MYAKERFKEKVLMKKTINAHSERDNKHEVEKGPEGAMPAYLLDREQVNPIPTLPLHFRNRGRCRQRDIA
jgi:hypothetical protein